VNLVNRKKLEKLKKKNRGNRQLISSIDELIEEIENSKWSTPLELLNGRSDADCVHSDGFYFFDINIHRTMILIEFEEDGEATVVWAGSHDEYETVFKNNRNTIRKWLLNNGWIK
jgi:mRNA interferase HigB